MPDRFVPISLTSVARTSLSTHRNRRNVRTRLP